MTLADRARQVQTREDLVALLHALSADLATNEAEWTNADLASFLEAMAAWVDDTDSDGLTSLPRWGMVASLLIAARGYE